MNSNKRVSIKKPRALQILPKITRVISLPQNLKNILSISLFLLNKLTNRKRKQSRDVLLVALEHFSKILDSRFKRVLILPNKPNIALHDNVPLVARARLHFSQQYIARPEVILVNVQCSLLHVIKVQLLVWVQVDIDQVHETLFSVLRTLLRLIELIERLSRGTIILIIESSAEAESRVVCISSGSLGALNVFLYLA